MAQRIRIARQVDEYIQEQTTEVRQEIEQQIRLVAANPNVGTYVNFPHPAKYALHTFDFEIPARPTPHFFRITYYPDLNDDGVLDVLSLVRLGLEENQAEEGDQPEEDDDVPF